MLLWLLMPVNASDNIEAVVKVNGGADRREVSVTSSSCMCNVNKLRLVPKTLC